ncbi:MAG TPA: M56 family metallopeptidase, partial [Planctomycetaceae bacterium]|nr:M56 family metallopeptidase [Planctomycetaceae bacterium]
LPAALELPTLTAMSDNAPELEWTLAGAESPTSAQIGSSISVTASGTTNSTSRTSSHAGPAANPLWTPLKRVRLWPLLAGLWLMGSVCWFAVQIARGLRFRWHTLRNASPSPTLQQQVHELAARQSLSFVPRVWLVDATVSPMLWGLGTRLRLLFPADLATRMEDDACATLLTHELAHYVRGDHYVRLLELVATGLFWWHPVVWWARRQIEEAEEECCDAYVLAQFPENPRRYAEALLDTLDFLCESRPALSPMTCGLGASHFLRRRLTKIMLGGAGGTLSPRVRCALLCFGIGLVLWQPVVFSSPERNRPAEWAVSESMPMDASFAPGFEADEILPSTDAKLQRSDESSPTAFRTPRAKRGTQAWATAASPNGWFVIRALANRKVILTDLRTDAETDLTDQQVNAVAFAPEGRWFVIAGRDGRLTQWDAGTGTLTRVVGTHARALRSVAVSPNGHDIVAGSTDGTVTLFRSPTDGKQHELRLSGEAVNCIRFSPDGRQLAVATGDWWKQSAGEVVVIDVATVRAVTRLRCQTSAGALAFPSERELIVGLWSGEALFWNLTEREVIGQAQVDKGIVAAAAFSPDNSVLREVIFAQPEDPVEEAIPFGGLPFFTNPQTRVPVVRISTER